jgi:Leucine-rich repeat (LRR) protein
VSLNLTSVKISKFPNFLTTLTNIEILNLSKCGIQNKTLLLLSSIFHFHVFLFISQDCKKLQELNLHGTNINSKGIVNLQSSVANSLRKLDISYTGVGQHGISCLVSMFSLFSHFLILKIFRN